MKVFKGFEKDETIESKSGTEKGAYRPADSENTEREDGMLVEEMAAQGIGHFNPDIFFEKMLDDYRSARDIYGERLISLATGESSEYVQRNIRIPEFQHQLREKLKKQKRSLEKKGLMHGDSLTDLAYIMAAQNLLSEALDALYRSSFNEERGAVLSNFGMREGDKPYRDDPYRDINVRRSIRNAVRRGHTKIEMGDLRAYERRTRPKREIVFCVDASGSMKGEKIAQARRAFFALSARAIHEGDRVGLLTFSNEGELDYPTTTPLPSMLVAMVEVAPRGKTSIARPIDDALKLFSERGSDKHIILITDMNPTEGEMPEREALEAAGRARERDISISVVSIKAEKEAEDLGRSIAQLAGGRFYNAESSELGAIVLQDYNLSKD